MAKGERPEEFDPSGTNEFQENLERVIGEDAPGKLEINIETDDSPSILKISDDSIQEQDDELPVIDTSCIFEDEIPQEQEVDDEVLEIISSQLASQVGDGYPEEQELKKRGKLPVWVLPAAVTLSCIGLVLFLLCGTKAGRNFLLAHGIGKIFGDNTTYEPGDVTLPPDASAAPSGLPELTGPAAPTILPDVSVSPVPSDGAAPSAEPTPAKPEEQTLFHFLLLGLDEDEEEKSTDLIMLLSIDTAGGSVKLTTVLRDLFVNLPGIGDDKICTAYTRGGITLVYQALEDSLGLRPDGYLLFTYDGFRALIDRLGGVSMTLTAKEADYLNKTDYISQPENRTLVVGDNHLNGDQALGYCRIRHVGTAQNEYNDIGRTARCRRFIEALYTQSMDKNLGELYQNLKQCFALLTTDITGDECTSYLEKFLNMKKAEFSYFRIPAEGSYTTSIIRGKSTLVADLVQNRLLWKEFLFPEREEQEEPEEQLPAE